MMQTCPSCNRKRFSFSFSTETKNWEQALQKCRQMGGTLANNLGNRAYRHLNSCLSQCNITSEGNQYWIGLVNWPNTCTNSPNVYQWVDQQRCINPSPLEVVSQPSNNACRSVFITINKSNNLPSATDAVCSNAQRFICQKSLEFPTTTITRSATSPTNFKEETTAFFNNANSRFSYIEEDTATTPIAIGITLGLLFLIILIAILYCRYKKINSNQIFTMIFMNGKKSRNVVSSVNVAVKVQSEFQESIYEVPDMNATPPAAFTTATNESFICTAENAAATSAQQCYEALQFPKQTDAESAYQQINDNSPVSFETSVHDQRRVSVVNILYHAVGPQQIVDDESIGIHNSSIQSKACSGEYDTLNRGISNDLEPKEKPLRNDEQVEDTAYQSLDLGFSTNNIASPNFQKKQNTENPASYYDQLQEN